MKPSTKRRFILTFGIIIACTGIFPVYAITQNTGPILKVDVNLIFITFGILIIGCIVSAYIAVRKLSILTNTLNNVSNLGLIFNKQVLDMLKELKPSDELKELADTLSKMRAELRNFTDVITDASKDALISSNDMEKVIEEYPKPSEIPEREKINKVLALWGIIVVIISAIMGVINFYLLNINTNIDIDTNIGLSVLIPAITLVLIVLHFAIIHCTHEDGHERMMIKYKVDYLKFKKCVVALNNHMFSKEEFIKGLQAPHTHVRKNILKTLIITILLYVATFIYIKLTNNNTEILILISSTELNILLSLIMPYHYSKSASVIDIHYENYLNQLSKTKEIVGVEMMLLFNDKVTDEKGNKENGVDYIAYSADKKEHIIGAKGIRVFFK